MKSIKLRVGLQLTHPTLGNIIVIAVHPMGTIDVRNIWTDRCYRISGLPINTYDDGRTIIETHETRKARA